MSFQDLAHATDEVARSLTNFVKQVPEAATDITGVVSELYSISAALRSLETSHSVPFLQPNFNRIVHDVELIVRASLPNTLHDIYQAFAAMTGGGKFPDQAMHRATWSHLWGFFHHQAGFSLLRRLKYYRAMLDEMAAVARGEPADESQLARYRAAITTLRVVQDNYRAHAANQRKQAAQAQHQHHQHHQQQQQQPPPPPANHFVPPHLPNPAAVPLHRQKHPLKSAMRKSQPTSPVTLEDLQEEFEPSNRQRRHSHHPAVEVLSQSESDSSWDTSDLVSPSAGSTESSASLHLSDDVQHWAMRIFRSPPPPTGLSRSGPPTKCYGEHMPGVRSRLQKEYTTLFRLDFPGSPMVSVSFHLRGSDHKTRILCASHINKSATHYSTMPITSLMIDREGSGLHLYRKISGSKKLEIWATLQFNTIERLVTFHCAFLALRGQDSSHPVGNIKDYHLEGEIQLYGGQILDDDFLHALRIFRDSSSKAVRLIASVHGGELDRVPVWNAFIHRQMRSSKWMIQAGPKKLYLAGLQRTIYIDPETYKPEITTQGYHVINFATEIDLIGFVCSVNDLLEHTRTF